GQPSASPPAGANRARTRGRREGGGGEAPGRAPPAGGGGPQPRRERRDAGPASLELALLDQVFALPHQEGGDEGNDQAEPVFLPLRPNAVQPQQAFVMRQQEQDDGRPHDRPRDGRQAPDHYRRN